MSAGDFVLKLEGVTKRFGALTANDEINLTLRRGECLALLGENGAGKTTLMNILFGHYAADAGRVVAFGRELPPSRPRVAIEAGIGMVHQHFALAGNLSVIENIVAGTRSFWRPTLGMRAARAKLAALAERFGLRVAMHARVDDLSVGERQRVEILKAIYLDARVLILDEPTAVLTHQEADRLYATLRAMAAQGLSLIFITHKLREALAAADRVVVLRAGRVVAERAAASTTRDELAELMVGRRVDRPVRAPRAPGEVVLRLEAAGSRAAGLADIDLTLRAGEILGVIGVSGNGQTALAELAGGLAQSDSGRVELVGSPVGRATPRAFIARGVASVPEDRHAEGAVGDMAIWENAILERAWTPRFRRFGFVRRAAAKAFAAEVMRRFDVRGGAAEAPIRVLSGGNLQKLILGRNLATRPRVLVAAQPTRGLDEGAVAAVQAELLAARGAGTAVLLISEDLDEILELADRVQAIYKGRLSPSIASKDADPRRLGLMMAGVWDEAS